MICNLALMCCPKMLKESKEQEISMKEFRRVNENLIPLRVCRSGASLVFYSLVVIDTTVQPGSCSAGANEGTEDLQ